jgi:hypothetical protein
MYWLREVMSYKSAIENAVKHGVFGEKVTLVKLLATLIRDPHLHPMARHCEFIAGCLETPHYRH